MKRLLQIFVYATLLSGWSFTAGAQERLCDTKYEDCRTPLINLIRTETRGIDVAFWFMQDGRYVPELINRHRAGVPVRILVDQQANNTKPGNAELIAELAAAGIPIRHRAVGDILHFKMMLFDGQDVVEFSKANYTPYSFVPESPTDYFDEAIFFTNDLALTNSFRRRFDDLWIDTSRYQNFANITTAPARRYPLFEIDASMNFPPLENFAIRAEARFDAEPQRIDAVVYRVTDSLLPNAMLRAVGRGVTVRLITESDQYRDLGKRWHSAHIDRMYVGGVQIRQRPPTRGGLMHQASVVLQGLGEVIFGSSNWTTHSYIWQDEHNYFYRPIPGKEKLWFFQWFVDQFQGKWNDTQGYVAFQPLPPDPLNGYLSPANGASGLSTTGVTLTWEGGPWAHLYDIYLGTSPTAPALLGQPNQQIGSPNEGHTETFAVANLQPGTTYYWRVVSKTWALQTANGPTWSFTTAGTPPGGGGGGGSPAYGGTPATIPGFVQAENFDEGGQHVDSYDTTAGNRGGVYRTDTDVDIAQSASEGGQYYVGWTRAGEWLRYTVNVTAAGTYRLRTRVANIGNGARFRVEVGSSVTSIDIPDTGGWDLWRTIETSGIPLAQGLNTIRVYLEAVGTGGGVGNLNSFEFVASSSPPPPPPPPSPAYGGTPVPVPGFVQAENFDTGGQSIAYHDTTAGNKGGVYRVDTDVDIGQSQSEGWQYYVGWTRAGEWLRYTVNVGTTGTYILRTRVANVGTGARFRLEVGSSVTSVPIPNTAGWDAWTTITTSGIPLTAGVNTIQIYLETVGTGGGVGNFNWFELVGP